MQVQAGSSPQHCAPSYGPGRSPDIPSLLQALRQIRSHLLGARLRQPSSEDWLQLKVVSVPCCPPHLQSRRRGSRHSALTCTYMRCIQSRLGKASANTLFMHLLNGFGSGDQCKETPKCSEKLKKPRSVDLPDQSVSAFARAGFYSSTFEISGRK